VSDPARYTVLTPEDYEFTAPSGGDPARGVMRLSDLLEHSRANLWRMPPGSRGRRHRETVQEEIVLTLSGTASLLLGEPPETRELPSGAIAVVPPGTPLQLANLDEVEAVVLIVGAPPTIGAAEYLPAARD